MSWVTYLFFDFELATFPVHDFILFIYLNIFILGDQSHRRILTRCRDIDSIKINKIVNNRLVTYIELLLETIIIN